jgi:hypothetical protein
MDTRIDGSKTDPALNSSTSPSVEERARQQREAWLAGPTEAEKEAWAKQEQMRRLAAAGVYPRTSEADNAEFDRTVGRYSREAQLALEGVLYWALRWPFEFMAAMVRAGRKWEGEASRAAPPRRVSLYDDEIR